MHDYDELVSVAMKIILSAGNARNEATEALKAAKKFDFETADAIMEKAADSILQAHRAQTEVIQREAGGLSYPHSLLFTHAQDTLMTINSEVRLSREMVDILKLIKGV